MTEQKLLDRREKLTEFLLREDSKEAIQRLLDEKLAAGEEIQQLPREAGDVAHDAVQYTCMLKKRCSEALRDAQLSDEDVHTTSCLRLSQNHASRNGSSTRSTSPVCKRMLVENIHHEIGMGHDCSLSCKDEAAKLSERIHALERDNALQPSKNHHEKVDLLKDQEKCMRKLASDLDEMIAKARTVATAIGDHIDDGAELKRHDEELLGLLESVGPESCTCGGSRCALNDAEARRPCRICELDVKEEVSDIRNRIGEQLQEQAVEDTIYSPLMSGLLVSELESAMTRVSLVHNRTQREENKDALLEKLESNKVYVEWHRGTMDRRWHHCSQNILSIQRIIDKIDALCRKKKERCILLSDMHHTRLTLA